MRTAVIVLLLALVLAAGAKVGTEAPAVEPALLYEQSPAVVAVEAMPSKDSIAFGTSGTGTGFVADVQGETAWIVTAKHVIGQNRWAEIVLPGYRGQPDSVAGTGDIWLDPGADVAVLRVKISHAMALKLGELPLADPPGQVSGGEFDCVRGPGFNWLAYPVVVGPNVKPYPGQPNENWFETPVTPTPGCSGAPLVVWEDGVPKAAGVVNWIILDPPGLGFVQAQEASRFLKEAESGDIAPVGG